MKLLLLMINYSSERRRNAATNNKQTTTEGHWLPQAARPETHRFHRAEKIFYYPYESRGDSLGSSGSSGCSPGLYVPL